MIRPHTRRFWLLLYAIAAALVLSGCSGGGSDTPTQPDPGGSGGGAPVVSGTAAAGAPLVGFVGARDINGNEATAQIGQGGGFNLDLTDLDTPVLLFASGISGGNAYQLLSVVLDDDINGTVNITPLTDLIVGNALGEDPITAFNKSGGNENERAALFSAISAQGIEDQTNLLATRLKPLLDALGVSEDFDLRKTPFTADRTGFDAVLDVIEVEVNVTNSSATIRNRLEPGSQINNTFDGTNDETETLVVNEATVTNGVTTIQAVDATLNAVVTAISSGAEGDLTPLLADNFLYSGTSGADFFAAATTGESSSKLIEGLESWSLLEIDDSATPTVVRINIGEPTGNWELQQTEDGFVVAGNQVPFLADADIIHRLNSTSTTPAVDSVSLTFRASNPAATLPAGTPVLNGPGVTDLQLQNTAETNVFEASTTLTGTDIDLLESGSEYTVSWDGGTETVASFRVRRGSPEFSSGAPAIAGFDADYISGEFEYSWTLPVGYESRDVRNDFDEGLSEILIESNTRGVSGTLPRTFSPSAGDTAALIAADNFGVLVEVTLENAFANVAPASAPDSLVGSYIIRNTAHADNAPYIHFSFFESGNYVHLELGDDFRPVADPSGNTGMEVGTYTWDNVTGAFEFTGLELDQNGEWGASHIPAADLPIKAVTTSTGLTLDFASGDIEQFERVPANSETGGITGTWAIQTDGVPPLETVVTLLDDGYYFIGDTFPASDGELPGIEFGTWSYNSDTKVLDYEASYDQNGVAGLADNGTFNGNYIFTVIEGQLIIDDADAFQLNELFAGNLIGDGTLTVSYTPPTTAPNPEPGLGISGDFHYLRSSSGIEGERSNGPASVFLTSYKYLDTSIVDEGDGSGVINYTDVCLSDILIDAGISQPPVFDTAAFCFGTPGSLTDLTFTTSGATLVLPFLEFTNDNGDIERLGQSTIDLFAADNARNLLLGFGKRASAYEDGEGFTSVFETGTHVLGKKGAGIVTGDLEGDWGMISFQLGDKSDNPDSIEYNVNALSMSVNGQGLLTRNREEFLGIIQGGNTNDPSVTPEAFSDPTGGEVGSLTVTSDGELGLTGGEDVGVFSGFLASDQNMLFLVSPDSEASAVPNNLGFHEWVAGIRRGVTPLEEVDLMGKEYTRFGQFYWVSEGGFFEVDYSRPGATVTFPIDSNIAEYRRKNDFTFTGFPVNSPVVTGESSNTVGYDFEYSVAADGLLTMTSTRNSQVGTDSVVEYGWANADASVILIANQYLRAPSSGGATVGGVGISYLICTNCD